MRSQRHARPARSPAPERGASESSELESQPISVYLRRQRELRGISVEELCGLTRIPLRSLQRLESGAFDHLSDGFVRGFVRTVADALGLDPDDTIARMLSEPHPTDGPGLEVSGVLPRALAAVAVMALIAVAAGTVRLVTREAASPVVGEASEDVLYRLDPVRALADAQAALRASLPPDPSPPVEVSPEAPPRAARAGETDDVAAAPAPDPSHGR